MISNDHEPHPEVSVRDPKMSRDGAFIGASVRRREDPRLLTGAGRFVDDIDLTGQLHAQFVRSRVAFGQILEVDLERTRAVPGVVAAFAADDLVMAPITALLDRPFEQFRPTEMPVLAHDTVRFIGEPIAIVIARTPYAAEDGVEAARVEYDVHDAIVSADAALAEGARRLHEGAPDNVLIDVSLFDTPGVDDAFETAAEVIEVSIDTGRQNALPMETRAALAQWDERESQLVLHTPTQVPHLVRTATAASLGLPERQVRVVVPDMGGGFGIKCVVGREEMAVAAAAKRVGKPVKWVEDRKDALTASFLAREQHYRARAAFAEDGEFLALEVDLVCDMGAFSCYPFTAGIEPLMASSEMPGVYRLGAYRVRGRAVATNKAPTAPYRGVSRPQYVMLLEQIMDRAGRRLGMDPLDVRRRNLITEFPYTSINNVTYDPGSYRESLDLCEEMVREEGWYERQREARQQGRYVGIGFSCFSERTGYGSAAFAARKMLVVPGFDISDIRMDLDGTVTVTSGTMSHGQSHETTMAQIVADALQMDFRRVKLHQGDTDRVTYGFGTFASRSAVIGGSAVQLASRALGEDLIEIAAHLMETNTDSLTLRDGGVQRRDDPEERLSFEEIANVAYLQSPRLPKGVRPGLHATASYDVTNDGTFSNATQAAVVELDPVSGAVQILRYFCVEDCGVAINPQVVEGQARGGIAQGIAGALYEEITYDANGEPSCASFMDYCVPTAMETPDIRIAHLETPCIYNETGAKGAGEGGTIGAPGAILGAVNDALEPAGALLDRTPITPRAVHAAITGGTR